MTTHLYYVIVDLTKPDYDYDKYWFNETLTGNDIFQSGLDMAYHNRTNPKDLRMFMFANKKSWDEYREHILTQLRKAEKGE